MNDLTFPFPILLETRDVVVINKPAGLAVHPGPKTPASLEDHLPALAIGGFVPVAAHRLDRDTSGCLAIARTRRGAKWLSAAFAEKQAEKRYWAILSSLPATADGLVDAPLSKVSTAQSGWRMVVRRDGKPARTHWRVLDPALRLVEFRPETGRTHQIRVHAAHIGCPISGDPVYGDGAGLMRLHARSLALTLPDGQRLAVSCDPPADWPVWSGPESQ
ncbi:RluA family pseudouridine synthase [Sandarakinorhabdus oryzae]|uniref:RluA family pseudouridine synthase n=1 Tax=Sandarakinorhabdus oryzae TaxID=2675220 RepID=UPI0012E2C045|nr:RNA pseudouridine synthase [Sandarakinorhabdus oryzae]